MMVNKPPRGNWLLRLLGGVRPSDAEPAEPEAPRRCPVCRDATGPFFRFAYGAQAHSAAIVWELSCPATRWRRESDASAVATAKNVKVFWYCRQGDIFQTGMEDPTPGTRSSPSIVIRIAGPVASGKSEVIRELTSLPAVIVRVRGVRDHSIPAIKVVHTAAIGAGMEYRGGHEAATEVLYDGQMTSRNNLESFLSRLPGDLPANDLVRDMLKESGLSDDEEKNWGSHRLPVVRRLSVEDQSSIICRLTLYYFDLPGELWSLGQTARDSVEYRANLAGSRHAMIAIDGALLTGDLDEQSLRESMRPQDLLDVEKEQRDRRDSLRTFLLELAQEDSVWDSTGSLPMAFVITKADMIRAALTKRAAAEAPLSAWLDPSHVSGDVDVAVESMLTDSVAALSSLADEIQTNRLRCSARVTDLLVDNNPKPVELRADHLRRIAGDILTHYADPTAFWELVRGSPSPLAGIASLRLAVENEDSYWRGAIEGVRVQDRDLVYTVLGAALMKNLDVDVSAVHTDARQVRYFLTCSREIILANGSLDKNAQGRSASSGLHTVQTHLIARTVQAAMKENL